MTANRIVYKKSARAAMPEPAEHSERAHGHEGEPADPLVSPKPKERKGSVPAIQLAHRHQVQTRNQQPDPRGHVIRISRRIRLEPHAEYAAQQAQQ